MLLPQKWGRRTEGRWSISRWAALFSDKRWTHWGYKRNIYGTNKNCKDRLAATVPEVSWESQQSTERDLFWAKFLIRCWWLTAAGCLRPEKPQILHQSGEGSNICMINKACNFWPGCSLLLHKPVCIPNGILGSVLDAPLKHQILHHCKEDTGAR